MKICIFAGAGELPISLYNEAVRKGLDVKLLIIENQYADSLEQISCNNSNDLLGKEDQSFEYYNNDNYKDIAEEVIIGRLTITEVKKSIEICRSNNITHIVFAGYVARPNLSSIKTDFEGAKLLGQILKNKFLGDDNLLSSILQFYESKGFEILGASDLIEDHEIKSKNIPAKYDFNNIDLGIKLLKKLSEIDVGQSAIISDSRVIAIEAAEGTDEMIRRSRKYLGNRSVLLKIPKEGQDMRVDMPTIGTKTIDLCIECGISGIAISKNVIILSKKESIEKANKFGLYIHEIKN